MQKILITGGTGLLALNWAFALRDRMQVTITTHNRSISIDRVNILHLNLDSVDNIISVISSIKPSYVIHTAGLTSIEQCELNPNEAFLVNTQLSENVSLACIKTGTPMAHISTDHLFDGEKSFLTEEENTSPVNIYGKSKAAAEKKLLDMGAEVSIIRTNFYGWGPKYRQSFSDIIINNLRSSKAITLFNDVFYTPIYIGTLILLVHQLLNEKAVGIYNVVGAERISKYDFGVRLAKFFDLDAGLILPGKISDNTLLVKRPYDMSLSNKKIIKKLGYKANSIDEDFQYLLEDEKIHNISSVQ